MSALPAIAVTAATGGTVAIPAGQYRREVMLRCDGARVFIGFNEDARVDYGIWIDDGEGIIIARPLCQADMYFICATTATINAETILA